MRRNRLMLMVPVTLTAAAAALWGCVAASLGGSANRDTNALLAVAITASAVAAACWSAGWARRAADRRWDALAAAVTEDRALLIRTLAGAAERRRELARTLPIRAR